MMWRYGRVIEIVVVGIFAAFGVALLLSPRASPGAWLFAFGFAGVAAIAFELRFWGHRRKVAKVRAALAEIGRRDLEQASPVEQRSEQEILEALAPNHPMIAFAMRYATRYVVDGKWKGRSVQIGTHVVPGRDWDFSISYVCVTDRSMTGSFRVTTRGTLTTLNRLGSNVEPFPTGDADFDAKWVADGNADTCRAVLDPGMRRRLLELQKQLGWLQACAIEVTRFGLVLRWPGELSPEGAAYLRDLALDVYDRIGGAAAAA
jgi:hypothetical protein